MPTAYTSLLGLALPVTGELQGTWGTTVNDAITSLLDTAVAGTTTLSTDADVTLTTTTGASNQARQAIILWTANGSVTRNITAPAQSKTYVVINASAGTQSIVIRGAGPTAGVTVLKGERVTVAWNGSDFVKVGGFGGAGTFTDLTVTGNTILGDAAGDTITVNGATTFTNVNPTLTAGTANGVLYLNGSKVATSGSALTWDGTTLGISGGISASNNVIVTGGSIQARNGILIYSWNSDTTNFAYLQNVGSTGTGNAQLAFALQTAGEVMRLTSTGLGIGTSSPGYKLSVNGDAAVLGQNTLRLQNSDNTNAYALQNAGATGSGNAYLSFVQSGVAERMRLDSSGNLGIGTSSPANKLVVSNAGAAGFEFDPASGIFQLYNRSTSAYASLRLYGSELRFFTGSSPTETMRLDSSGNLGLGVTPSAWGTTSSIRALQLTMGAFNSIDTGTGGEIDLVKNAYFDGGSWRYVLSSSGALRYRQYQSEHAWFNAGTGTAGNAISFTQAMTLDASGNLGVGTTSPAQRLDVVTTSPTVAKFTRDLATDVSLTIGADNDGAIIGTDGVNVMRMFTGGTERARITSGGDLLVGTTNTGAAGLGISPTLNLTFSEGSGTSYANLFRQSGSGATILANGYKWSNTAAGFASSVGTSWAKSAIGLGAVSGGTITFYTDPAGTVANGTDVTPTERARITSGGDLLVGTTGALVSSVSRFRVSTGAAPAIDAKNTSASDAVVDEWNSATSGDNQFERFWTEGTATQRGSIDYNRAGGLVRYNTTSDYRAKDIIGPVQNPGATIDALKVYEGVMKGATQSRPMLIAHEAQEHAPYAVSGVKDEVNEDGTPKFQQMDVSSLVPLLLAEIQSLRARVAALEAA